MRMSNWTGLIEATLLGGARVQSVARPGAGRRSKREAAKSRSYTWIEAMEDRTHLSATISGTMWYDQNADGIRQDTEPAATIQSMQLYNLGSDNTWLGPANDPLNPPPADILLDSNSNLTGQYSFTINTNGPGVFGLWASNPTNSFPFRIPTYSKAGNDPSRDSDFPFANGRSAPFVVRDGDQIVMDIGLTDYSNTTELLTTEQSVNAYGQQNLKINIRARDNFGNIVTSVPATIQITKFDEATGSYNVNTPYYVNYQGPQVFQYSAVVKQLDGGGFSYEIPEQQFYSKGKYRIDVRQFSSNAVASVECTLIDDPPTAGRLSVVPRADGKVQLTAANFRDPDDYTIDSLEFWADADGSGTLNPSIDQLLKKTYSTFNQLISTITVDPADWGGNVPRFFAKSLDKQGVSSPVAFADLSPTNQAPRFSTLPSFQRLTYIPGTHTNLDLTSAYDPDGFVTNSELFWDIDGNGQLDSAIDQLIPNEQIPGVDQNGVVSGSSFPYITLNLPLGVQTILVRLWDNAGANSVTPMQVDMERISGWNFGIYGSLTQVDSGTPIYLLSDAGSDYYGTGSASIVYYLDSNDNSILDLGAAGDLIVGSRSGPTMNSPQKYDTAGWPTGSHLLFARVTDNQGFYLNLRSIPITVNATAAVGVLDISADIPTTQNLSAIPMAFSAGVSLSATTTARPLNTDPDKPFKLSALDVVDPDGLVKRVQFYLDTNKNGKVDDSLDRFIGLDTDGSNGWSVDVASPESIALGIGSYQFIARAEDDHGVWGVPTVNTVNVYWKPKIESLTSSAPAVAKGSTLRLTANNVTNPNSNVAGVEFYRDVNGNGIFDSGTDTRSVADTTASDGWFANIATTTLSGYQTFFARAKDSTGRFGDPVSVTVYVDAPPTLTAVTSSSTGSVQAGGFTLTATGAADTDGTVTSVEFYRDRDGNGSINPAVDDLLGSDTNGADGWSLVADLSALALPTGAQTFLARAVDNFNIPGTAKSVVVTLTLPPTIGSLTAPASTVKGTSFTLTATNTVDPDGTVASVEFWRDANGNGVFDALTDIKLATDTTISDGWKTSVSTTSLAVGAYTFFARAKDNRGVLGQATSTVVSIVNPVTLPTPTLSVLPAAAVPVGTTITLTAGNTADAVAVEFYLDTNNNGKLELTGTTPDTRILVDTTSSDGFTASLTLNTSGTRKYFARSIANTGQGFTSKVLSVSASQVPAIDSLTVPARVTKGTTALITANGVLDPDGTVAAVQFYRDVNGNGIIDAVGDSLVVTDTTASNGFSASVSTTSLALGPVTFLARAKDNLGLYGEAKAVTFVIDAPPTLPSFTATPTTVAQGSGKTITLTATAADTDGSVTAVEFWRDGNGNGVIDATPGVDELLFRDADAADGWSFVVAADQLPVGSVTLLARAQDNAGGYSATKKVLTTITAAPAPLLASLGSILTPVTL